MSVLVHVPVALNEGQGHLNNFVLQHIVMAIIVSSQKKFVDRIPNLHNYLCDYQFQPNTKFLAGINI